MSHTHRYCCRAVCKVWAISAGTTEAACGASIFVYWIATSRLACMRTAALSLIRSLILVLSCAFSLRRSCRLCQRWRSAQFLRFVSGLSLLMLQEECLRAGCLDTHALILGSLCYCCRATSEAVVWLLAFCMLTAYPLLRTPHSCEGVLCLTSSEK